MQVRACFEVAVIVLVLCGLGSGCQGPSSGAGDSDTTKTAVSDSAAADSTQSDSSADTRTADSSIAPDPPPPAPAPGTARIRGSITACDSTGPKPQCRIEVTSVLAYGSATPTLNTGERTVFVAPGLLDEHSTDSLTALGPWVLLLKHEGPTMKQDRDENDPDWSIHEIREPGSSEEQ